MNNAEAIKKYILAKDGNRPHLLNSVFAEEAVLQMVVRTDSISFPSSSVGREEIADTLVRQFNQKFENIYTICIGSQPKTESEEFSCNWLVVMSEKQDGALRVGCGRYDWKFEHTENKAQSLVITIDTMEHVPDVLLAPAMTWVSSLPYPWCELSVVANAPPDVPAVLRVIQNLHDKRT